MSPIVLLTLLSSALTASTECPADGRIRFYKSDAGFDALKLLGDDSYASSFVGRHLETRAGEGSSGTRTFSVDDLTLAWELVPDSAFAKAKSGTSRERLDSFYAYQTKLLRGLARQRKIRLTGIQSYEPHEEVRSDGKSRSFRIWEAIIGKKGQERGQYWVATSQDAGVVLLSVVVRRPADDDNAKLLIDSYMASFVPVDASTCAKMQGETAAAAAKR